MGQHRVERIEQIRLEHVVLYINLCFMKLFFQDSAVHIIKYISFCDL
jgi:hypothetical protein